MDNQQARYYKALRANWGLPAGLALQLSRDYVWCKQAGITFEWIPETESPESVFGEPDSVNGPFYDKNAEFECCIARAPVADSGDGPWSEKQGQLLDSLGMIDGAHNYSDYRGYWFLIECEMASVAKDVMIKMYE